MKAPRDFRPQPVDVRSLPVVSPPTWLRLQRYPNEEAFQDPDRHAAEVADIQHESFKDLLFHLIYSKHWSALQSLRCIFRWLTLKNMNTIQFAGAPPGTPEALLMGFKDQSTTYGRVFELMCIYSNIPCLTVSGYAKGVDFRPGQEVKNQPLNHSWNVVFVEGSWQLVDCHWATRFLRSDDRNVPDSMVYEYDDFYFCPDPRDFIYSHFPADSKWQLLGRPLTLTAFEDLPVAKSHFFKSAMCFLSHHRAVISTQAGTFNLSLGNDIPLNYSFKLLFSDNCKDEFQGTKLYRYGVQETHPGQVNYFVKAPMQGFYYFTVYASPDQSAVLARGQRGGPALAPPATDMYHAVCEYKIKCPTPYVDAIPYPVVSNTAWGPSAPLYQTGVVPLQKDGVLVCPDGLAQLGFEKLKDVNMVAKVQHPALSEREAEELVDHINENDYSQFDINLPVTGDYAVEIYVCDPEKDGNVYTQVAQYLVVKPERPDQSDVALYEAPLFADMYNEQSERVQRAPYPSHLEDLARSQPGARPYMGRRLIPPGGAGGRPVGGRGDKGGAGGMGATPIIVTKSANQPGTGLMGPGGSAGMGPGGASMGPGGASMGPGGVSMGPSGASMGPGGAVMGPGGVGMGPGGASMGPGGVGMGPGGAGGKAPPPVSAKPGRPAVASKPKPGVKPKPGQLAKEDYMNVATAQKMAGAPMDQATAGYGGNHPASYAEEQSNYMNLSGPGVGSGIGPGAGGGPGVVSGIGPGAGVGVVNPADAAHYRSETSTGPYGSGLPGTVGITVDPNAPGGDPRFRSEAEMKSRGAPGVGPQGGVDPRLAALGGTGRDQFYSAEAAGTPKDADGHMFGFGQEEEGFPPPPPASDMLSVEAAPRLLNEIPLAPADFEPMHVDQLLDMMGDTPLPAPAPIDQEHLAFSAERAQQFHQLDQHAVQVSKTEHNSFRDLIWDLIFAKQITDDLEKARLIFLWLCTKDLSKMSFDHVAPGSPEEILMNIKDGRSTYAKIYETLCSYAGLHCKVIHGYAKGSEYKPGMRFEGSNSYHAWNAVVIDQCWRLIDCHWASRRMMGKKGADNIIYELDDYYFLVDPSQLVYTHYPEDHQWQLLERPYNLPEFEDLPPVKSLFFRYQLQLHSHTHGVIYCDDQFSLQLNFDKYRGPGLEFTFSLQTDGDGHDSLPNGMRLSRFCLHEVTPTMFANFWIRMPAQGAYKFAVYAREFDQESSERMYSAVAEYMVVCDRPPQMPIPFPECSHSTWGLSPYAARRHDVITKYTGGVLRTSNGQCEVRFKLSKQLLFSGKLKSGSTPSGTPALADADLQSCILYRTVGDTVIFSVSAPACGEYGLDVFVNDPSRDGKTLRHMCQYLIVCDEDSVSGIRFPQLPAAYLGPQPAFTGLGLTTISHRDPLVHCAAGEAEISFKVDRPLRSTSNLLLTATSQDCTEFVLQQFKSAGPGSNEGVMSFAIRLPQPGIYKFQIYAQPLEDTSDSLPGVYNYLINCSAVSRAHPLPFPKQFSQWKEGCYLHEPVDGQLAAAQPANDPHPNYVFYRVEVGGANKVAVVVGSEWTHLEKKEDGVWEGAGFFQAGWGKESSAALTANYGSDAANYNTLLEYSL